jgi:hypothetical protein
MFLWKKFSLLLYLPLYLFVLGFFRCYRPGPMQAGPRIWSGGEPSSHKRVSVVPWQTRPAFVIYNFIFAIYYFVANEP